MKIEYRLWHLAELGVTSPQFIGDVDGHVTGPALGGVEGHNARWMRVLAVDQIADQRLAVGRIGVGLALGASQHATEVIEDKVGVLLRPMGRN